MSHFASQNTMLSPKSSLPAAVLLLLFTPSFARAACSKSIRWVDCREHVPSTLDLTGVNLSDLPPTLHCGQLDVPMDYSRPLSPNNRITLGLAMYRPAKPKGVLFVFVTAVTIDLCLYATNIALWFTETPEAATQ